MLARAGGLADDGLKNSIFVPEQPLTEPLTRLGCGEIRLLTRLDTGTRMARYLLSQAARRIGVAPITLKRWLLKGRVEEVQRDRNGWRIFTEEDIVRIREYAETVRPPQNPRSPSLFRQR